MARLTKHKVRRNELSKKLATGTVHQQKIAALKILEEEYEKTQEPWMGAILRKVARCSPTYRCNSKHCPECSNPRASKAKRRKACPKTKVHFTQSTTVSKQSKEYRIASGQRGIAAFKDIPPSMTHCITINLEMVALTSDLKTEVDKDRRALRRVMKRLSPGAIARGKFDVVLKYADDLAFELPDDCFPVGVTNNNLPHQRMGMLHIHFVVFDPWLTRLEIRDAFAKEFPGASRVCAKQTRQIAILSDGTMVGGAQGYLEYGSMEKVDVAFGSESDAALLEFCQLDSTWTRANRNFSFGKPIEVSKIEIDMDRASFLEKENRLAWVRRNWSKLGYAEKFIHLWFSGAISVMAGVKSLPEYRKTFAESFNRVFLEYSNWARCGFFEVIDFMGFLNSDRAELPLQPPG